MMQNHPAPSQTDLQRLALEHYVYAYAEEYIYLEDGSKFSFDKHNYLIGIYTDRHPYMVIEKSAQMGASIYAMSKAFYVLDKLGKNVIYFFPTDTDVLDFSKTRAGPLIANSPHLESITGKSDSLGLRQVNRGWLYFRGMRSTVAMKCHSDDTEVLTNRGWKLFKDASLDDLFATRSPAGEFMWQAASEIQALAYNGKMYCYAQNGLNACVTPNHRMLLQRQTGKEVFKFAKDVGREAVPRTARWKGKVPKHCIKTGRRENGDTYALEFDGRYIDLRDFCAFLGFYLAEGSLDVGKSRNRVVLTQVKYDTTRDMLALLKRIGGDWVKHGSNYRYTGSELAAFLRPLGTCDAKYVPQWIKDLPPRFLIELWRWAVKGDGHIQDGHTRYGTTSKRLADDYMEILSKLGKHGSIVVQKPPKVLPKIRGRVINAARVFYNVFERESVLSTLPEPQIVNYRGMVYCATVPNGTLLTRRLGQSLWSGNSIPADFLIFDELDEVPEKSESLADQRLNHSTLQWRLKLSTPTFENYGIDREFKRSDQRYWNLICECGAKNILEFEFPDCVKRLTETVAVLICRRCKRELNRQYGEWIAEKKVEAIRGYHICGLYSAYLNLSQMMDEYDSGRGRDEFYRSKLGIAYVSSDQRVTLEMVQACRSDYEMHVEMNTFMGVDQKGDELHIVIRKPNRLTGKSECIFIGKVEKFEQLDDYIRRYDVNICVIDGTPNQHSARDFSRRFPGRVYLCYYQEHQKGEYAWKEQETTAGLDYMVIVNRTEALDAMYEQVQRREVSTPIPTPEVEKFETQLTNLARVNEEDDDGTIMRAIWKRLGEDHYAHAASYSLIAQSKYGEQIPTSIVLHSPLMAAVIKPGRNLVGRY